MTSPFTHQLKHDQNGRIIEKTETVANQPTVWKYVYDTAGRLTEATLDGRRICQCWYDREGRRSQDCFPATHGPSVRRFAYRMDNRLQSAGNNTFTHDENGFRCIWNHEGQYTTYEYAPDHRLLRAEKKAENATFEYTHDEDGQRECKRRNGRVVEAYAWLDFLRLAGFHDGEVGCRFHYADGERTPRAMEREDGVVAHLFYDQVGSLRVVADSSGHVIKEILYDPFGGIIEDTNPDLPIPIGFAGGLHDRDLGFVRFGWRDYDAFTGRWTAPDPIGDAGGDPDWYGYCLDDPVNGNDPLGLWRNEHGQEIPKGRTFIEYFPGIDTPFAAYGTRKKVRKALRDKKDDHTDPIDIGMRNALDKQADDFGMFDAYLSTWKHSTDEETIEYQYKKAKERIGN